VSWAQDSGITWSDDAPRPASAIPHELILGTQMDVRSSVICDRPKSGPWSRIYGSVTGPTLMGRSNLGAEPILMHGVAPHMCDESSATLLRGSRGSLPRASLRSRDLVPVYYSSGAGVAGRSLVRTVPFPRHAALIMRFQRCPPLCRFHIRFSNRPMSPELRARAPRVGFERPAGARLTTQGRTPT